jgi:hypothetical protein
METEMKIKIFQVDGTQYEGKMVKEVGEVRFEPTTTVADRLQTQIDAWMVENNNNIRIIRAIPSIFKVSTRCRVSGWESDQVLILTVVYEPIA